MKTREPYVPSALRQVWEWKDSINREVAHLPPREAIRTILEMSRKAGEEFSKRTKAAPAHQKLAVAEVGPRYGERK